MVGFRRTNSCETCRRKKVKCDEVRPVCGPCAKTSRECIQSSAFPPIIWAKSGQHCISHQKALPKSKDEITAPPALKLSNTYGQALRFDRSITTANGAVSDKYRVDFNRQRRRKQNQATPSRLLRSPNLSPVDQLRLEFIIAHESTPKGFCVCSFTSQVHHLPPYIGQSAALNSAATCLVETHASFLRGGRKDHMHDVSYQQALVNLQAALNDPHEGKKSTTLAAIALLSVSEALGRLGTNHLYTLHAGGMVAFIKVVGIGYKGDDLGKAMIISALGPVVMESYSEGTRCILSKNEWRWLWPNNASTTTTWDVDLGQIIPFSRMASLLIDIHEAKQEAKQTGSFEALLQVFEEGLALRQEIYNGLDELNKTAQWDDPANCLIYKNSNVDKVSPLPYTYDFRNLKFSEKATRWWGFVIQINSILVQLHVLLKDYNRQVWTEETLRLASLQCAQYSRNICCSISYAKQFAPLGSGHLAYPMCVSWSYVSDEWKGWVLEELGSMCGTILNYGTLEVLDSAANIFFS